METEIVSEIAVKEISLRDRALSELNKVDVGIAELRTKYSGKVYDCTNALGMAQAKADRVAVRTVRYQVPKITDDVTKQLNGVKKEVQAEGARIEAELLEIENVSHNQIQAEELRKETEKVEKARLAAIAQKILDDMILDVAKLPLKCIGESAADIGSLLTRLELREIGGEFTGDTRVRAEAAKLEAVAEIRKIHTDTLRAEEEAATLKTEQEAEAIRLEAERVEADRLAAIQREEMAAQQLELDEQKRLNGIEAARLKELADAETERVEANRKIEQQASDDLRLQQEAVATEEKRVKDEAAAALLETERQAAIVTEQRRVTAERERKAADKARKLAESKCADAATAFKKIYGLCNNGSDRSQADVLCEISDIAESMI